jgi:5-methylcytosine-specific restriction endonuclease McrA
MNTEQIEKLKINGRKGYRQYTGEKMTPIPEPVMHNVISRDKVCVYCGHEFGSILHRNQAEWEHIDNNANHVDEFNIALCCGSCNNSKKQKTGKEFLKWLEGDYCKKNEISEKRVAPIIISYINRIKEDTKKYEKGNL